MRKLIAIAAAWTLTCSAATAAPAYKGMSYTSFNPTVLSSAGSDQSLVNMSMLGTDAVAINFWWYQESTTINTMRAAPNRSATFESVSHAIDQAHSLGMKVLLKPMLDVDDGTWRAYINPPVAQRDAWFANYTNFIGQYADLAEAKGVELFSIGCEMNGMENAGNTQRWTDLIANIRSRYSGRLTYAANHDSGGIGGGYQTLPWWNQLDVIGLDAYFVLTGGNNPTAAQLRNVWNSRANTIETWRANRGLTDKQVIFTEVGIGSYDGANTMPFASPSQGSVLDEQEQAAAYEALLDVMSQRSWWDGAFWWNWETNPNGGGATNFTPQFKLASDVLAEHYGGVLPAYPRTAWNSNNNGQWAGGGGGGVWTNGTPNNNFIAEFDRGGAAAYTVALTGNRTVDQVRVGSNAVTFQSNNATLRNLTADGQHTGDLHRGLVIGADDGDVGSVTLTPTIGTFSSPAATLGDAPNSDGSIHLTGAPTVWNIGGSDGVNAELIVGRAGVGVVTVRGGADVNVTRGDGDAVLGKELGSLGGVLVSGAGSTFNIVGNLVVGAAGDAELAIEDGGVVKAALTLIGQGGELSGDGALISNVVNSGVVSPGASRGVLSITGNFTQVAGGGLHLEIADAANHDKLAVSGEVKFKGDIVVSLLDGAVIAVGDQFDLLDFAGSVDGQFVNLWLPDLGGPWQWDASQFFTTGVLAVVAVPEPAAACLAMAALVVAMRRRRERSSVLGRRRAAAVGNA